MNNRPSGNPNDGAAMHVDGPRSGAVEILEAIRQNNSFLLDLGEAAPWGQTSYSFFGGQGAVEDGLLSFTREGQGRLNQRVRALGREHPIPVVNLLTGRPNAVTVPAPWDGSHAIGIDQGISMWLRGSGVRVAFALARRLG